MTAEAFVRVLLVIFGVALLAATALLLVIIVIVSIPTMCLIRRWVYSITSTLTCIVHVGLCVYCISFVKAISYNGSIAVYNSTLKGTATVNVTSLQPGTVYNISVIPCNMGGCNESCEIHSVLTGFDTGMGGGENGLNAQIYYSVIMHCLTAELV